MTTMYLYIISQGFNDGYDTYDSAIVAAENEEEARNITPCQKEYAGQYWASSEYVKVEKIGEALPHLEKGVILGSFNAG